MIPAAASPGGNDGAGPEHVEEPVIRRPPSGRITTTKAIKDRLQAGALLRVLLADLPGEISLAWTALSELGAGAVRAVRASVGRLEPDLVEGLEAVGITRR